MIIPEGTIIKFTDSALLTRSLRGETAVVLQDGDTRISLITRILSGSSAGSKMQGSISDGLFVIMAKNKGRK